MNLEVERYEGELRKLRKVAEMALVTLEEKLAILTPTKYEETIKALRQALAQPEQKPVAWGMVKDGLILDVICPEEHAREPGDYTIPLYTAPPKRQWVGLTDEEVETFKQSCHLGEVGYDTFIKRFAIGIEAKLKEKNT